MRTPDRPAPGLPGKREGFTVKEPDRHAVFSRLERIGRLIVSGMNALAQLLDSFHHLH
jgi:hypothetical protein